MNQSNQLALIVSLMSYKYVHVPQMIGLWSSVMVCNNIKLFKNPEINGEYDMTYLIFNTYTCTFIGAHLCISHMNMLACVNVFQNFLVDAGKHMYNYTCILFLKRCLWMVFMCYTLDWYPNWNLWTSNYWYTWFYYDMFLDIIDFGYHLNFLDQGTKKEF